MLRNHLDFDPLESTRTEQAGGDDSSEEDASHISIKGLQSSIGVLALPGQEILVTGTTHSLHEHRHLAYAVQRALSTTTSFRADALSHLATGPESWSTSSLGPRVREDAMLDSAMLADELASVSDILARGMLASHDRQRVSNMLSSSQASRIGSGPTTTAQEVDKTSPAALMDTRYGSFVLPVFFLSLAGMPSGLLLNGQGLFSSTKDLVMVLQTEEPMVETPYFAGTSALYLSSRAVQRHVLAGVASSLAGLLPPTEHFSRHHNRTITDFFWGHGHHPFEPFGNSESLSLLHQDAALRNSLLSRLSLATSILEDGLSTVDSFIALYLFNPYGQPISHQLPTPAGHWLDSLFEGLEDRSDDRVPSSSSGPDTPSSPEQPHGKEDHHEGGEAHETPINNALPQQTVIRLQTSIQAVREQLIDIGKLLDEPDTVVPTALVGSSPRLQEALRKSASLLTSAQAVSKYAKDEVARARERLVCCSVEHMLMNYHHHEIPTSPTSALFWLLCAMMILMAFMMVFSSSPAASS